MQPNPYEAPKQPSPSAAPSGQGELTAGGWVRCPACNSDDVVRPGFTWWGGALGPRLLSHVKCNNCGHTYNGKSGQSNTTGIIIYSIVVGAIALALVWAINM